MSVFQVRGGQFWLNGQPTLIQAGEFHYFRTPADQWAHRLGLLQTAGFNAVAAYIPWLWHQPQPDLIDLDGHSHPMRDLAGFLDLAAAMGLSIIARPGPYIMAETINEGVPPWVFSQYPGAAFIGQDGRAQNFASCLHPDFLKCVEGWYQAVFQVLAPRQAMRGGSILMIQLDNEMGMLQWVRNLLDLNPDTLDRFARWLKAAYGDRLAERYPTAGLTDFLQEQIAQPEMPHAAMIVEDYRRFYRLYLRDYAAHLWARAAAHGMEVPPVINIHGFGNGGKTFPIGLSQLSEAMRLDGVISATDVYPLRIDEGNFHQLLLVNEMTKALQNPQQPLFSIEFQAGGNQDFSGAQASLYDLHSRLCLSSGMRAINHYLFFDGENDPLLSPVKRHDWGHPVRKDGTLRRQYARYPKLSRVLKAYGADLALARPQTITCIGFLLDAFMTEVNNAFSRPAADILTHQRDVILFDLLARGLALTHRPFEALELSRARLDPAGTPLLWVMMEKQCDAAVQERLAAYVRQGGELVLVGRMCEETFDHAPCTILRDALGIQSLHSDPPFTAAGIHAFDTRDIPAAFLETYAGAFDEVFARSADGQVVGFIQQVGTGQVMVLGAALAANTLDDLGVLDQMAERMGCRPAFTLSEWADVRLSQGENGSFLFVSNYQDDPVETVIASAEGPLLGGQPLVLPARRGVILPLEWRLMSGVVIHYATSEIAEVIDDGARLTLKTDAAECVVELSAPGWQPAEPLIVERLGGDRLKLRSRQGVIEFTRG
ncbi:MAG: beta-galactosidase [Anaerolineae bacterium]|nr:beta-galactosidase [Anaerolineae bacterium]NUQ05630.1 beta-galactosidase [Anaerolineae bacterium]